MSEPLRYSPHPRIAERKQAGPPKITDVATAPPDSAWYTRFNANLAVVITKGVGTMWCAYAFAALSFVSLPAAIGSGSPVILVSWISQTFLQLVLLSIIIVGQNILAAAADKRAEATYKDSDAILTTTLDIHRHLEQQDKQIRDLMQMIRDAQRTWESRRRPEL
ncbi:hypothetical protein [Nocardia tengchongensis]|uniref:hypothetical protein n=1 Tax=Nocardia tengchongensis TaxID=2055889 RepID=UPI003675859A